MLTLTLTAVVAEGASLGTVAAVFAGMDALVTELQGVAAVDASWVAESDQRVVVSAHHLPLVPAQNGNGAHLDEDVPGREEIAASPVTKRGSGKGVRYGAQDPDALRVAVLAEMRRLAVTVDGVEYAPSTQRWDAGRRDGLPTSAGVCKRLGKRWTELCGAAGLAMNRMQMAHVIGEAKADSSGADDAPEEDFR